MSNAIKYKREEEKPNIDIRWQNLEGYCEFAVEDNGIGIADGYFDQIFVAFKRLHGKEYPGSGVGLTICRDIVKEHGGRIWVESELGRGTTFFFTLPRAEHSA